MSLEKRILLPMMDAELVAMEIGEFVVNEVLKHNSTGCVIGLSGGVDSTTTAAVIKRAFNRYNAEHTVDYTVKHTAEHAGMPEKKLELVGYMLPSKINDTKDTEDGIIVAERLGIRYEVQSIDAIVDAYKTTNPEAFPENCENHRNRPLWVPLRFTKSLLAYWLGSISGIPKIENTSGERYTPDFTRFHPVFSIFEYNYHKGNLMSRIRANVLSTRAATENKTVAGTGNKDEDFSIGYYTLFGDGAVHISPIGALPKRLVRQMASYLGFSNLANRTPTAGLEPGQTDFRDLGYDYDLVEIVIE
ncbi:MAG: NAD(+) synthase, partial [Thaumarchaeota archaeon]|nr:NAD(+) synthase [Nitrososphaerota archaeon]